MSTQPIIDIVRLRKAYGIVPVLHEISLAVTPGEVLCVLGPSGSGKTTMLRCINQLETIQGGYILLAGQPVGHARDPRGGLVIATERQKAAQRRLIGMVFQQFNLFPHLTALDNVMEGPIQVMRKPRHQAREKAMELLTSVGLADHAHKFPAHLSGGQQQRVAIARALACEPEILLFDEPTSALDPEWVGEVLDVMHALADTGITMVVVTHEVGFARDVADSVAIMADGAIIEYGPARQVLDAPASARAEAFLRRRH